jgi:hypothetical protein
MDAVAFQFMQEAEDEEDAIEVDMYCVQHLANCLPLITEAEASRDLHIEHQNQTRNYVCRPQL